MMTLLPSNINMNVYDEGLLTQDRSNRYDIELVMNNIFKESTTNKAVKNYPINWNLIPFGDDEWKFLFHRMEYAYDLCVMTIKTNNPKYILKAKDLIFEFISKHSSQKRESEQRTLDTAIRLIMWCKCIDCFKQFEVISANELEELHESMKWQTKLLYTNFSQFQSFSNWGLVQTISTLNCAKYIDVDEQTLKFYEKQFKSHLQTQFMDDGIQWEQSSGYCIAVTEHLLQLSNPKYYCVDYIELLRKSGIGIYAMSNFDLKSIPFGDGDEINTIGLLQHIGYITKDQQILSFVRCCKLSEKVYLEFGSEVLNYFKALKPIKENVVENFNLSDGGYYVIKSDKDYFSFQNGCLGGGHGHFDNLHVNLSRFRQRILIDSGRFSYVEGYDTRQYYKQTSAHNGFDLDENIYQYKGAWGTSGSYIYTPIYKQSKANITYLEASVHKAEMGATRAIFHLPTNEVILLDSCNLDFSLNFIVGDNCQVKHFDEQKYLLGDNTKAIFYNSQTKLEQCFISPTYGVRKNSHKIVVKAGDNTSISCFINCSTIAKLLDLGVYQGIELYSNSNHLIIYYKMTNNKQDQTKKAWIKGEVGVYDKKNRNTLVFKS